MASTNMDTRGVSRGECTQCDCNQFECSLEDTTCNYCKHPGPAHKQTANPGCHQQGPDDSPAHKQEVNPGDHYPHYEDLPPVTPLEDGEPIGNDACFVDVGPQAVGRGSMTFIGHDYYGDANVGCILITFFIVLHLVIILVFLTLGLIMIIIFPLWVYIVYQTSTDNIPAKQNLRFDHEARCLISDSYEPIPYDQIRVRPICKPSSGASSPTCLGYIYADVPPRTPSCCMRMCISCCCEPRKDWDPILFFSAPNDNVLLLRDLLVTLSRDTAGLGLQIEEPNMTWEAANSIILASQQRRRRRRRRR